MPEAFSPKPAKLSKMMRAKLFQLLIRNAKTPTNRVFLTRRARMSSSAPHAQNRPASVTIDCRKRRSKISDVASE